jgi:hypothetical protein
MVVSAVILTTMVAVPFVIAVTLPVISTLATAAFDETQVTVRDAALRSDAVSFADCPSSSVSDAGFTNTAGGSGFVDSHAFAMRPVASASNELRHLTT